MIYCDLCSKELGFFNRKYKCAICGADLCNNCKKEWLAYKDLFSKIYNAPFDGFIQYYLSVCLNCYPKMEGLMHRLIKATETDVELVSKNYKGKKPYVTDGKKLESDFYRDRTEASREIQTIAAYWDYQAIVNFEYVKKVEEEESESGHGIHKYTVWKCQGEGARIKRCQKNL